MSTQGISTSPPLLADNWRRLSNGAHDERDPEEVCPLLERLYGVVNEGKKSGVNRDSKARQYKAAQIRLELDTA